MLNSKQFYTFPVPVGQGGMRFVNINNIAHIEDLKPNVRVTLNVKDDKGEFISFIASLPFGHVTGQIVSMDDSQHQ